MTDALTLYLDQAAAHQLLTAGDEQRLGRAIAAGRDAQATLDSDPTLTLADRRHLRRVAAEGLAARDAFARANVRLVVSVAATYSRRTNVPLEDLVQDGNIGLLRAIDRFDPDRGFKFSTYATHWIRQAMQRNQPHQDDLIRLPHQIHTARTKARAATSRLISEGVDEADITPDVLAEATNTNARIIAKALKAPTAATVLDAPAGGDATTTIGDLNAAAANDGFVDELLEELLHADLHALLGRLGSEDRALIVALYGLDGTQPKSMSALAREQRCSNHTIRARHDRIVTELHRQLAPAAA